MPPVQTRPGIGSRLSRVAMHFAMLLKIYHIILIEILFHKLDRVLLGFELRCMTYSL